MGALWGRQSISRDALFPGELVNSLGGGVMLVVHSSQWRDEVQQESTTHSQVKMKA